MIHIQKYLKKKKKKIPPFLSCLSALAQLEVGDGGPRYDSTPLLMSQIPVFLSLTYYL